MPCMKTVLSVMVLLLLCEASLLSRQNRKCSTEQHRPRYHFTPTVSWMNDPNGLVYYDGVYHLFYQYYPYSKVWGPMHWGHATSPNLVTWKDLDIALYPDTNGYIFSGSCVVDYKNSAQFKLINGKFDPIVAIFTSASSERQSQSLAYSLDNGMTFEKYDRNPVLVQPDSPDFRDPKVFYHDNEWIMSLAVRDKIEFFSSPDLKNWTKQSEFGNTPPVGNHDGVWECPDLLPLTININEETIKLWVLFVSINYGAPNGGSATQYFIGNFTQDSSSLLTFQAYPWKNLQWIDWGPDNYAGVRFSNDPDGRTIYIGWMNNWDYAEFTPTASWRGQMTVPRELSLRILNRAEDQYRLVSTPVKELASLRIQHQYLEVMEPFNVSPQTVIQLTEKADFKNPLMEIEISLEIQNNPQFAICAFNSLNEEVCFGYDKTNWYLDRSKTGNINFHSKFSSSLLADREIINDKTTIKIFLDVSSIEVFADDGLTTMTGLHYPSESFDRLYINHWSVDRNAIVIVKSYKIWGLQCSDTEEQSETERPSTGSTLKTHYLPFAVVISICFVQINDIMKKVLNLTC